ncbi:MAG: molybdopterin-guanine dinucleotide biosynthesis protein MobB [Spirochaetes bacterium]|nr:molybdopterin-guanine dinucleotide biosynthesis protein MobB [Spirochaetota bacterium]
MGQHERNADSTGSAIPHVVAVAGLKRSGKTTVASALIAGLRARGFRVGSVKTIHGHTLSLDVEGTDTRRHAEAGAEFTIALLDDQMAYFEPRSSRAKLAEAARLFRPGVQFVVWEGMVDPGTISAYVVCLRAAEDLERTLSERRVDPASVIAISGIAAGSAAGAAARVAADVPVHDATDPAGLAALVDLIIRRFGEEDRA